MVIESVHSTRGGTVMEFHEAKEPLTNLTAFPPPPKCFNLFSLQCINKNENNTIPTCYNANYDDCMNM